MMLEIVSPNPQKKVLKPHLRPKQQLGRHTFGREEDVNVNEDSLAKDIS